MRISYLQFLNESIDGEYRAHHYGLVPTKDGGFRKLQLTVHTVENGKYVRVTQQNPANVNDEDAFSYKVEPGDDVYNILDKHADAYGEGIYASGAAAIAHARGKE